ncbi:putative cytochrome b5-like heme/steroid binding domain, cytochrome b5, heme-binding protein [Helianthus annuus]|nr:putative cytochrome b5-like heme/steroid binding domain, cytochrome b5, heme-binding protein [Helianthus annuus]
MFWFFVLFIQVYLLSMMIMTLYHGLLTTKIRFVYDVTPFLDDHPGGAEALLLATEKDATEDFETVGHSQDAKDQMKDYYVGELDNNTMPQENGYNLPSTTASASNQAPGSSSTNILTFVLPVLILILAFALYYYPKIEMAV